MHDVFHTTPVVFAERDQASELGDAEVFADRLLARGDPRGELLRLEIAAERATDSAEARRLNGEAQKLRVAHQKLVWPAEFGATKVGIRAGFVVAGRDFDLFWRGIPIERLLSVRRIRVVPDRAFEACVQAMIPARKRGLSLDSLTCHGYSSTFVAHLGILRSLTAIAHLALPRNLQDLDALASLRGPPATRRWFDRHIVRSHLQASQARAASPRRPAARSGGDHYPRIHGDVLGERLRGARDAPRRPLARVRTRDGDLRGGSHDWPLSGSRARRGEVPSARGSVRAGVAGRAPQAPHAGVADSQTWRRRWRDAPKVLAGLPKLRSFVVLPSTMRELAKAAAAFPELCPYAYDWPRTDGEV